MSKSTSSDTPTSLENGKVATIVCLILVPFFFSFLMFGFVSAPLDYNKESYEFISDVHTRLFYSNLAIIMVTAWTVLGISSLAKRWEIKM